MVQDFCFENLEPMNPDVCVEVAAMKLRYVNSQEIWDKIPKFVYFLLLLFEKRLTFLDEIFY